MTEQKKSKVSKKDKIDYEQLAIPKIRKSTGGTIDYSLLGDPKPTGKKKKGKKVEEDRE